MESAKELGTSKIGIGTGADITERHIKKATTLRKKKIDEKRMGFRRQGQGEFAKCMKNFNMMDFGNTFRWLCEALKVGTMGELDQYANVLLTDGQDNFTAVENLVQAILNPSMRDLALDALVNVTSIKTDQVFAIKCADAILTAEFVEKSAELGKAYAQPIFEVLTNLVYVCEEVRLDILDKPETQTMFKVVMEKHSHLALRFIYECVCSGDCLPQMEFIVAVWPYLLRMMLVEPKEELELDYILCSMVWIAHGMLTEGNEKVLDRLLVENMGIIGFVVNLIGKTNDYSKHKCMEFLVAVSALPNITLHQNMAPLLVDSIVVMLNDASVQIKYQAILWCKQIGKASLGGLNLLNNKQILRYLTVRVNRVTEKTMLHATEAVMAFIGFCKTCTNVRNDMAACAQANGILAAMVNDCNVIKMTNGFVNRPGMYDMTIQILNLWLDLATWDKKLVRRMMESAGALDTLESFVGHKVGEFHRIADKILEKLEARSFEMADIKLEPGKFTF